jgi:hypothetical protein
MEAGIVASVREAEKNLQPADAVYGRAEDETLLDDSRLPLVRDGVLRVLRFTKPGADSPVGLLVQWNCHPENLGSKNTLITADFCYDTVRTLEAKYRCPVAYFTGAVGGLMSAPEDKFPTPDGKATYREGDYEFSRVYGEAVAALATKALESAQPIRLTPLNVSAKPIVVPMTNPGYRLGRVIGVLPRVAVEVTDDFDKPGRELPANQTEGNLGVLTEVAYLRLGELHVAAIPGEIYPELVYGQFQDPIEPNVDFPDAPLEPAVMKTLPGPKTLLFGLANDEIGYIIPRRQWDEKPPFAYKRERGQYGEINSVGPDSAPILMNALKRRVAELSR